MYTVTISPKFQVVIPRAIRESLRLEPGQKVQALRFENRIEFIPLKPIKSMRGFLKGIDTRVPRERDRACQPTGRAVDRSSRGFQAGTAAAE